MGTSEQAMLKRPFCFKKEKMENVEMIKQLLHTLLRNRASLMMSHTSIPSDPGKCGLTPLKIYISASKAS
jgi:hypothetical protein